MSSQTTAPDHVWIPTPRQAQVLHAIAEAPVGSTSLIFYGGAASGGKTNLLANLAIELAIQCPGSRTLVGRQDFLDLRTTTLQEFDRSLPSGIDVVRYESPPVYRDLRLRPEAPYSRVYFRGLDDWQSLMSEEFGFVLIDEAHQVSLQAALGLMSRLRHLPERKWGMVCCFNPFPSWCVEWGMRGRLPPELKHINVRFVQARVDDNPHVREGYRELLAANPDPVLRSILLDGNPDAALDTVLYFQRQAIDAAEAHCSEPIEQRETRMEPGGPASGYALIWEKPLLGERYYIGADTADGRGEPLSAMGEFSGPDRNHAAIYRARDNLQVAAIHGRQEEHHFARILDEYGRWYNNALLAVERNRPAVLSNLRQLAYPNLATWAKPTDMRVNQRARRLVRQMEFGWLTDEKTRPVMLAELREAISMNAIRPRDAKLFEELRNFGYPLNREGQTMLKPQALNGYHDDRVMAHAIAWQARKGLRSPDRGFRHLPIAV